MDAGSSRSIVAWCALAPCRDESDLPLGQMRWRPIDIPAEPCDFLSGLRTIATCWRCLPASRHGEPCLRGQCLHGPQIFLQRGWRDATGAAAERDPRVHRMRLIDAEPGEVVLIPKGMKFKVDLPNGPARGYVCENYGAYFTLPERGPIGANCLANARDFLTPVAAFEDREEPCQLYVKALGKLYVTELGQSPLDVVAWHGNFAPCKYDLRRFSPVGSVLFDHPDPSIYTVLTSASDTPGTANVDFVIFPERWIVMENSFRPAWYHMNVMSEFMGLIYGVYDAKPQGFVPGGMSLHNALVAHGPDAEAFERASNKKLEPEKLSGTMAFMFETRYPLSPTAYASNLELLDGQYPDAWDGLKKLYAPGA